MLRSQHHVEMSEKVLNDLAPTRNLPRPAWSMVQLGHLRLIHINEHIQVGAVIRNPQRAGYVSDHSSFCVWSSGSISLHLWLA